MSPRKNRRDNKGSGAPKMAPGAGGFHHVEHWNGEDWAVRHVAGAAAIKVYRCPGCDHEIRPGVAHVVVWPIDAGYPSSGVDDRRHWHRTCWSARGQRRVTTKWGRKP